MTKSLNKHTTDRQWRRRSQTPRHRCLWWTPCSRLTSASIMSVCRSSCPSHVCRNVPKFLWRPELRPGHLGGGSL